MVSLIHLLVFAICAYECILPLVQGRRKIFKILMFGAVGVIHGLIPALTPRRLMWAYASDGDILFAAVLTLAGALAFAVAWRLYESRHPQWDGLSPGLRAWIDSANGQRVIRRLFLWCAVLGVAGWLGSLIASAGSLSAAWSAGRFAFRGEGHLYVHVILSHVANLVLVPVFLCFFLPSHYRVLGVTFGLVAAGAMFVGTQGARTVPIALIGALMFGYALRYRLKLRRLVTITVAGTAILLLAISLYEVRKVMYERSLNELGEMVLSPDSYADLLTRDPLNYHQMFVAAVRHFPRDHGYLNGATYLRLLVFYLPRQYFSAIKPEDTHNTFAKVIQGDFATTTTIPPTMFGDGYINFWGAPGVLLMMLVNGLALAYAAQRLSEHVLWFLAISPSVGRFVLLALRGSPYEMLLLALSSFLFVFVLAMVAGLALRREQARIRQINAAAGGIKSIDDANIREALNALRAGSKRGDARTARGTP